MIVSELVMTQVILILLVVETVALLHYSKMKSRMECLSDERKERMIEFMEKKMAFYESKEDESLDPLTRQHFEGEYIEIMNQLDSEEPIPPEKLTDYMLY